MSNTFQKFRPVNVLTAQLNGTLTLSSEIATAAGNVLELSVDQKSQAGSAASISFESSFDDAQVLSTLVTWERRSLVDATITVVAGPPLAGFSNPLNVWELNLPTSDSTLTVSLRVDAPSRVRINAWERVHPMAGSTVTIVARLVAIP